MKTKLAVAAGFLLAAVIPMLAHHSFAAEFDDKKPVTLKGTVTKLEWLNPHIWIYFDAKDDQGAVSKWQCEGGPPNSLTRQGWSKNSLKIGSEITIEGFRAKDASNTCNSRTVTVDGRRLFS